jgi:transglutaminase-like putative cysteine protease
MIYDVRQTTRYSYPARVATSRQTIRMQVLSRQYQRVVASSIAITPAPSDRRDSTDFFGNATVSALIVDPHTELSIATRARVEVDRPPMPAPDTSLPWEEIRARAPLIPDLGPASPVHFIFPTPLVPIWAEIGDYCRESFTPARPILAALIDLTARMKADFTYDPTASDVTTPVSQSFIARAGVCQDFAHIMISGLRTLGLPAAYISGYLRTEPPPGKPRLEGADAMHAWVDVWCGEEIGWQGFDPTNGIPISNDYIVLAIGRDYSDVSPTVGTLKTHGTHSIAVAVDVVPVDKG